MNPRRAFFTKLGQIALGAGLSGPLATLSGWKGKLWSTGGKVTGAGVIDWATPDGPPPWNDNGTLPTPMRDVLQNLFTKALNKMNPLQVLRDEQQKSNDWNATVFAMCFMCQQYDFSERVHYSNFVRAEVCEDCIPKELSE